MPATRIVALIALAAALLVPSGRARANQTWLVVSDIHLNPFATSSYPAPGGEDSNLALFDAALAAMHRAAPNPTVVLLPGDFLAHRFQLLVNRHDAGSSTEPFGLKTMSIVAARFARTFPHARFAIVLGNNDDPCGDYRSETSGPYLEKLAKIWQPLVDREGAAPDFTAQFERGGYYTAALPVRGLRLVALNTVYFSREFQGDCTGARDAAIANELAWLKTTLETSPPGTRNVLLMHIPPGYDATVTEMARGIVAWPFYDGSSASSFLSVLDAESAQVAFAISGHAHRFDVRLIPARPQPIPLVIIGAVSPVYRNAPNFSALDVGDDGTLHDIATYAFDAESDDWTKHDFAGAWLSGGSTIDAASIAAIHGRLGTDPAMRARWGAQTLAWATTSERDLWGSQWRVAWCAQVELGDGFGDCAGTGALLNWLRFAAIFVPGAALIATLVVMYRRRRRT